MFGTGLACAALLVGTVPAMAAPAATTYHGTWTSADDCTATDVLLSGIWNVTLRPDGMANVHITLFKEGVLHAVWGGKYWRFDQTPTSVNSFDLSRGDQQMVLTGDDLVYTIQNFCAGTGAVEMRGDLSG